MVSPFFAAATRLASSLPRVISSDTAESMAGTGGALTIISLPCPIPRLWRRGAAAHETGSLLETRAAEELLRTPARGSDENPEAASRLLAMNSSCTEARAEKGVIENARQSAG
ncbi:hypothetical protein T484DRAFT_1753624 [Baffinella frigidus]|nr:hypothetical protein T484DRAFT_1753624 [Cryptophyta sp. CCMP2293]